jgi:hypothetical protein
MSVQALSRPTRSSLCTVCTVIRDHVKPTLPFIDFNNCLGVDTHWLSTPRQGNDKAATANCLGEYIAARRRDPEAIICMRVSPGVAGGAAGSTLGSQRCPRCCLGWLLCLRLIQSPACTYAPASMETVWDS